MPECHMMTEKQVDVQAVAVGGEHQVDAGRVMASRRTPAIESAPAGAWSGAGL